MKQHLLPYGHDPDTQNVCDKAEISRLFIEHRHYNDRTAEENTHPADLCLVLWKTHNRTRGQNIT